MVVDIVESAEGLMMQALIAAIIIQALSTWFFPSGLGKFSLLLYDLTDPILTPVRRVIPPLGMLDLSPMIAIVLLLIIGNFLMRITGSLA
jgi:YggT family protein